MSSATRFVPGAGVGLARLPLLALVAAENASLAERLWKPMERGQGIDVVLEELLERGLRGLGDFALAEVGQNGERVRVVLRGSATAQVEREGRWEVVGSGGAHTWLETTVGGCRSLSLLLGTDRSDASRYRVQAGVVPASELVWSRPLVSSPGSERSSALAVPPRQTRRSRIQTSCTTLVQPETPAGSGAATHAGGSRANAGERSSSLLPVASTRSGPLVLGLLCPAGHSNAPEAKRCRVCGEAVTGSLRKVARPPLGVLLFSSGHNVILSTPAVIGRKPRVTAGPYAEVPQMVRLDVGSALSRAHVAVRLEGWQVLVDDLGSLNGTSVTLPGKRARRLRSGERVVLKDGATIDLGGEVVATFDEKRR